MVWQLVCKFVVLSSFPSTSLPHYLLFSEGNALLIHGGRVAVIDSAIIDIFADFCGHCCLVQVGSLAIKRF